MADTLTHAFGITPHLARFFRIKKYPGYSGAFTRRQAKGAYRNGTAVAKVAAVADDDGYPIGSRGRVLGSLRLTPHPIMYFVEWDAAPGVACSVVAWKIREVGK